MAADLVVGPSLAESDGPAGAGFAGRQPINDLVREPSRKGRMAGMWMEGSLSACAARDGGLHFLKYQNSGK